MAASGENCKINRRNIRPIASEDSTVRALSSCCMRFKRARIPDVLRIRVVDRGVSFHF